MKSAQPGPSTRTGVSIRFNEIWVERPMRVWRWVVLRCSLEGGIQMHMVLACPILNPARAPTCSLVSLYQNSIFILK